MEASHAHDEAEKKKRIMEKRHGTKVHRSGQQTSIDSHLPWKETKNMNQESTLHVRKLRCSERRRGHRRRLGNGGPARAGSANVLGFGWGWCTLVFTGKPAEILSLLYCQDISCNYCWECTDWCSLVLWKNPSICFLPLSLSLCFFGCCITRRNLWHGRKSMPPPPPTETAQKEEAWCATWRSEGRTAGRIEETC